MKRTLLILLLLFGTLGIAGTTQAYSNVSFSFSYHDALGPYGTWVNVSNYGNVFRPNVYAGWRPYTVGHWVYTDYGPMWDTAEPFGWATYHYGHWIFTAAYGWVWVPGYEYYPSRVTWAYGDGYLGWSPIYPNPGYSNANFWIFINNDHFGYNNYSPYYLRRDYVQPLFDRRVVRVHNDYRWDRDDFERVVDRPVRVVKVRENTFEANGRRVRMVVPESRESQVIREVSRAAKVKNNRNADSQSKVVAARPVEKSRFSSPSKRVEVQQSSRSKTVKRSEPKAFQSGKNDNRKADSQSKVVAARPAEKSRFSSPSKRVEAQQSSRSKTVKRSEPKAFQSSKHATKPSSSSKRSSRNYSYERSNSDKKYRVERSYSPKSKALIKSTAPRKSSSSQYSKYSAPKKSSTEAAKFTSKRHDVKPKTSYTSNKKSFSKQNQSKQRSVKRPVHKQNRKS